MNVCQSLHDGAKDDLRIVHLFVIKPLGEMTAEEPVLNRNHRLNARDRFKRVDARLRQHGNRAADQIVTPNLFSSGMTAGHIAMQPAVFVCIDRDVGHRELADLGDFNLGVRLTMALLTAIVLLGLVLEDDNLLAADLADDLALNLDTLDNRSADLDFALVLNEHDVKRDGGVNLSIDLLDVDHVALTNAVLLATSRNNSVHMVTPPIILLAGFG